MKHRVDLKTTRMTYAYECAEESLEKGQETAGNYKSYVRKMPALIMNNGLISALAFARQKGKGDGDNQKDIAWGLLFSHFRDWIKKSPVAHVCVFSDDLLADLLKQDSRNILLISRELMALLVWMKRAVEIKIEDPKEKVLPDA